MGMPCQTRSSRDGGVQISALLFTLGTEDGPQGPSSSRLLQTLGAPLSGSKLELPVLLLVMAQVSFI